MPPPKVLREALEVCVSDNVSSTFVPVALILAHHPLLEIPETPSNWKAVAFKIDCGTGASVLSRNTPIVSNCLCEYLVSPVVLLQTY